MTKAGTDLFASALEELGGVLAKVDGAGIDAACEVLVGAGRIAVYGCGREALQVKGFAMRLYHLGLPVSVVGDMTTPPLGKGDVFLVSSGPGETTTVLTLIRVARDAGAKVLLVTAESGSSAARLADFTLLIPAQTMASDQGAAKTSVLPMGSLFEGALFLLFEVMVLKLKALTGASPEAMRARHTNME
ncbi:SIS domain-containing protein [Mesorhizobium sp. M4B.F.Ca.ET.215.01.1.1]|uniref:SIS domain-containing protein n=1 Tax=unclassified Mesorhizobium TaxID=325217 RepID=UPI000FD315BC|nr:MULTISPECIES: SIS domain-containing protein [unclassified Mesorhizobium]RUW20987.1 SIS domain-containing protein [Mesorhizobium sp. M4B.F.Ca.ET.013.02.1.1]RWF66816.1 MAG: SIS domain-containing protein [Mesorhizobium sp.]TGQ07439.1 SIS domain-containing protein [Mesorhizobium sp. M4B.F.Ca.ET.215.01.1.1]TGQ32320.1 SIS domain-containing protein [Mesorhizobium sp. M4B.F.Ca.ET.214.01.1.1]TGQ35533.1 SIS domain-containing protein [Mesorhizobium sp. M00.F.Ca.ET.220.01.1.1]